MLSINDDRTPLYDAAWNGYVNAIKVDVKAESDYSWTPLHLATRDDNTDAVKLLIELRAEK